MKNSVVMNRQELEAMMLFFEEENLEGVAAITRESEVDEKLLKQMVEKGFFERPAEDGPVDLNPFVKFVFWTVFHSQSSFIQMGREGDCCNFYFHGDTIIYLEKERGSEYYIFRWLPFINIAIGGFSLHFDWVEGEKQNGEMGSTPIEEPLEFSGFQEKVKEVLSSFSSLLEQEEPVYFIGKDKGEIDFLAALLPLKEGCAVFRASEGKVMYETADHLSFIQSISPWLVSVHGKCIKRKGGNL